MGDFRHGSSKRKAYLIPNDLIITFHISLRLEIFLQHEKILIRTKVIGKNVSSIQWSPIAVLYRLPHEFHLWQVARTMDQPSGGKKRQMTSPFVDDMAHPSLQTCRRSCPILSPGPLMKMSHSFQFSNLDSSGISLYRYGHTKSTWRFTKTIFKFTAWMPCFMFCHLLQSYFLGGNKVQDFQICIKIDNQLLLNLSYLF